eukprot:1133151-Pelagomonas_calceolata.AAC.10
MRLKRRPFSRHHSTWVRLYRTRHTPHSLKAARKDSHSALERGPSSALASLAAPPPTSVPTLTACCLARSHSPLSSARSLLGTHIAAMDNRGTPASPRSSAPTRPASNTLPPPLPSIAVCEPPDPTAAPASVCPGWVAGCGARPS